MSAHPRCTHYPQTQNLVAVGAQWENAAFMRTSRADRNLGSDAVMCMNVGVCLGGTVQVGVMSEVRGGRAWEPALRPGVAPAVSCLAAHFPVLLTRVCPLFVNPQVTSPLWCRVWSLHLLSLPSHSWFFTPLI
ncbi:hypothetical protein M758_3G230900 [Ceratodon purpureus]|nr:hypothetical protein M758_3G230900 [Ceratodon purpureus]